MVEKEETSVTIYDGVQNREIRQIFRKGWDVKLSK